MTKKLSEGVGDVRSCGTTAGRKDGWVTLALADPRLDPMPFLRQALPRGLHAPRGLAPIYRTVMGLGADGADGWEASKATGLR